MSLEEPLNVLIIIDLISINRMKDQISEKLDIYYKNTRLDFNNLIKTLASGDYFDAVCVYPTNNDIYSVENSGYIGFLTKLNHIRINTVPINIAGQSPEVEKGSVAGRLIEVVKKFTAARKYDGIVFITDNTMIADFILQEKSNYGIEIAGVDEYVPSVFKDILHQEDIWNLFEQSIREKIFEIKYPESIEPNIPNFKFVSRRTQETVHT